MDYFELKKECEDFDRRIRSLSRMQLARFKMCTKSLHRMGLSYSYNGNIVETETLLRETFSREQKGEISALMQQQIYIKMFKDSLRQLNDPLLLTRIVLRSQYDHVVPPGFRNSWLDSRQSSYYGALLWKYKIRPLMIDCGYRQHGVIVKCSVQTLNIKTYEDQSCNGLLLHRNNKRDLELAVPYNWCSIVEARGLARISSCPVIDVCVRTSNDSLYGTAQVLTKWMRNSLKLVTRFFWKLPCGCASFGASTDKAHDYACNRHKYGCAKPSQRVIALKPNILLQDFCSEV